MCAAEIENNEKVDISGCFTLLKVSSSAVPVHWKVFVPLIHCWKDTVDFKSAVIWYLISCMSCGGLSLSTYSRCNRKTPEGRFYPIGIFLKVYNFVQLLQLNALFLISFSDHWVTQLSDSNRWTVTVIIHQNHLYLFQKIWCKSAFFPLTYCKSWISHGSLIKVSFHVCYCAI